MQPCTRSFEGQVAGCKKVWPQPWQAALSIEAEAATHHRISCWQHGKLICCNIHYWQTVQLAQSASCGTIQRQSIWLAHS